MKNNERTKKLISYIKKNKNGFSLNYSTLKEVNKNYVVSFTHIKSNKNLNLLLDKMNFISLAFPQLKKSLVVGGWYDNISKAYFLDFGLNIKDKKTALIMGNLFKQFAIFNLNEMNEIRL